MAAADDRPEERAIGELLRVLPVVDDLGGRFAAAGRELALVGGSVRDALLGRLGDDLDFATSARPEQTERLLDEWADTTWAVGAAYGTIGARRGPYVLEVTTYRSEAYERTSRKPEVAYGDSLDDDLVRRDFTVNAMAVTLPDHRFVDPYGGRRDLTGRVLRTPGTPEASFTDDPLRMLRAARFAAQLGFDVAPEVRAAMTELRDRLAIVSAERIRVELEKLLLSPDPRRGLELLVDTGLAEVVLPELPALQRAEDEHRRHKDVYQHSLTVLEQAIALEDRLPGGGPDLVVRLAALLHDVGKPATRRFGSDGTVSFHHHEVVGAKLTRKRLTALRFPKDVVDAVTELVRLHLRFHGYGTGAWTDSAVRRYVVDAGDQLERLHVLTRSDSTTRNRRRALALQRSYDALEADIARLREREALDAIRPDLDGNQIMALLGVGPGPVVGRAYQHLLELRLDRGPLGQEAATAELRRWWAEQPESRAS